MRTVGVVMPVAEQRGGAELMLRQFVEESEALSVRSVVIFLEDGPMVRSLRDLGASTHVVRAGRVREVLRGLRVVAAIRRILVAEGCEVVISWMTKAHAFASPAATACRIPAVLHQLGMPDPRRPLDRAALALPTAGVVVLADHVAARQRGLRPRRAVRVVAPGVDLERFDPDTLPPVAQVRAELDLPPDGPLVGIVGRLQAWKGMHVLIEALPTVLGRYPDAHCVIVGGAHPREPGYGDELQRLAERLGVSSRVTFAGLQPRAELWMRAMDVVVHASDQEPFGIVVLEAMALGKPVIAGDSGGPAEVVEDQSTGLLVAYGDAPGMAAAILRLLDDPAFAAGLGRAGRECALTYSPRRYAEALLQAVDELAPRRAGALPAAAG